MEKLQNIADRQWRTFYASGSALGIWLIALVLVLCFARDLGIITTILVAVSFSLSVTFSILFVGEGLKAQSASRAVSAERNRAQADNG